jgi:hypothetical protein
VQAEAVTIGMKKPAQRELRLRIFASYCCHHPRPGLFIYNIHFRLPLADVAHEL